MFWFDVSLVVASDQPLGVLSQLLYFWLPSTWLFQTTHKAHSLSFSDALTVHPVSQACHGWSQFCVSLWKTPEEYAAILNVSWNFFPRDVLRIIFLLLRLRLRISLCPWFKLTWPKFLSLSLYHLVLCKAQHVLYLNLISSVQAGTTMFQKGHNCLYF